MSLRRWALSSAAIILATIITIAVVAEANLDFAYWEPLGEGEAVAESTSLLSNGNVVLIGGNTAPNTPTTQAVSISAFRSLSWGPYPLTIPIPVSGIYSTIANNWIYVSIMSTDNFTIGDGGVDDISKPDVYFAEYVKAGDAVWYKGSLDTATFAPRRRAGMFAFDGYVFFVGGVDAVTQEYIPNILRYDLDSREWTVNRTLTDIPDSVCDCTGHVLKTCFTTLMCRSCNKSLEMEIFVFDPCMGTMKAFAEAHAPASTVSIASTTLGHYVIALITVPNDEPIPLYLDMFQNQMNVLSGSGGFNFRHHGTMFTLSNTIYYAGGYDEATGDVSNSVQYAVAVPSQYASVDRDSRIYTVGDTIAITTETCLPGTTIQLSDCPMCMNWITEAVPCIRNNLSTSGFASLVPHTPAASAYVCMSNGICPQDVSQRVPCVALTNTFEACKDASCCWDNTNNTCFAFVAGDPYQMFFDVVSPIVPLSIVAPDVPDRTNRFVEFIKSPGGIILLTILGLGLVLGGVAVVWFRVIPKMNTEEDDDDDGHPLDQYGKYKLVKKLGQGGFGQVFLVKRKRDDVLLALKYIITPDETERNYAVKEFEMLHGAQGHPNMIHLEEMLINWSIDNGSDSSSIQDATKAKEGAAVAVVDDKKKNSSKKGEQVPLLQFAPRYVCIIMEFCPEGDLSGYILSSMEKGKRGLPESMVLNVVCAQVCELLIHLHNRSPPIVHRDMKPENILIKNNGTQVVVTDFGLAQQLEKSYMTTRAGSLHYVAPECWKKKYTSTVDMWALGCILYGCCTGRVTAKTARVMFSDARNRSFTREVSAELGGYSPLTRSIILGLLRPDPATRLTAQQVLEMIKQDPNSPKK